MTLKRTGLSDRTGKVQTVLGLIEPADLGVTMHHEHALIDQGCYFEMPDEATERWYIGRPFTMEMRGNIGNHWAWNRDTHTLLDEKAQIAEVYKLFLAGGNSMVDTTSIGIARDPLALTRISRATGLNIVMGGSFYVPPSYPEDMVDRSEQDLTDGIIHDITVGVGETGVKTGIIGEIGNAWPTNEITRRVLRASAQASTETGAPILIHPGFDVDSPLHIMADLIDAGADPTRVVMAHQDVFSDVNLVRKVAETGAMIEYDHFGFENTQWGGLGSPGIGIPTDVQRMQRLEQLIAWGYGDRLLVSHDICIKPWLTSHGGKGYAHVLESIVPRMRRRGFSENDIQAILVDNPRRILTFK